MRVVMFRLFLMLLAAVFGLNAIRGFAQTAVADPVADEKRSDASVTDGEKKEGAEEKSKPESLYLRVQKSEEEKPKALQTAIVRYKGKSGTPYEGKVVDLVGVVHIGQKEYYEDLNVDLRETRRENSNT